MYRKTLRIAERRELPTQPADLPLKCRKLVRLSRPYAKTPPAANANDIDQGLRMPKGSAASLAISR